MNKHIDVSGIILAGGRGNRMGGRDKGLALLNGRSLVQHVIDRVSPQVDDIVISANRNTGVYAGTGYRVVKDLRGGFEGPLAGIHACLPRCRHERVLVVPCDMPYLPNDLVSRLCRGLDRGMLAVVESQSRLQPAFLMDPCLLGSIEDCLDRGNRSLIDWIESTSHRIVRIDDPDAFTNFNLPEQFGESGPDFI